MTAINPGMLPAAQQRSWMPSRQTLPLVATLVVFLLMYAAASVRYNHFFEAQTAANLVGDNAVLGVIAIGMTFVILAGGIDLSVGAGIGFTTIFIATRVQDGHWHPVVAIFVALLIGTLLGAAQGLLVALFELPPFLVTLGGLFLYRGLGLMISHNQPAINHPMYRYMSRFHLDFGNTMHLKLTAIIFLVLLVIAAVIAAWRPAGRAVYALGGSEQSALLMGLPVTRIKVSVYAVSGLCAAIAGVVMTINTPSGAALNGVGMELDAIAAVVIGGTLLSGGVGGPVGTLLGVLIFGIIRSAILFEGNLSSWWARIVLGLLLLAFILLQTLLQPRENHA